MTTLYHSEVPFSGRLWSQNVSQCRVHLARYEACAACGAPVPEIQTHLSFNVVPSESETMSVGA